MLRRFVATVLVIWAAVAAAGVWYVVAVRFL